MPELIDTQWDVKQKTTKHIRPQHERINRYIVGCKDMQRQEVKSTCSELIDTQWDVKAEETAEETGINRYIVGCKDAQA